MIHGDWEQSPWEAEQLNKKLAELRKEIDRLLNICLEADHEDFKGDSKYKNKCWDELKKIGCYFPFANNYDFQSTKDGVVNTLLHLKKMLT